jgi:hypothetical protein
MPNAKSRRKKSAKPVNVYQLKIALRYIAPPIWRRILVPDNLALGDLHHILYPAMGWAGYHLHSFSFGGGFAQTVYLDAGTARESRGEDEYSVRLRDVIYRKGQAFSYEYDFGDSWLHQVKVEKILPYDPAMYLPICLGGERACPPEDCGSFPGYAEILKAIATPQGKRTEDQKQLLEWAGPYDPEAFDLEAVNRRLPKLTL